MLFIFIFPLIACFDIMFSIWGLVRGDVWDDDDGETPPFIREMSPQHSSSHNCYLQLLQLLQQPPALPCQPWSHLHRSQQRFALLHDLWEETTQQSVSQVSRRMWERNLWKNKLLLSNFAGINNLVSSNSCAFKV